MIKIILIFLLIGNLAYAEDAIYLNKDQKAPYSGYLLDEETVKGLRNAAIDRDLYKNLNDSNQKSLALERSNGELKDKKIDLLLAQNDNLAKTAYSNQSLSTWEKIGYIGLGMVITVLAFKGARELSR